MVDVFRPTEIWGEWLVTWNCLYQGNAVHTGEQKQDLESKPFIIFCVFSYLSYRKLFIWWLLLIITLSISVNAQRDHGFKGLYSFGGGGSPNSYIFISFRQSLTGRIHDTATRVSLEMHYQTHSPMYIGRAHLIKHMFIGHWKRGEETSVFPPIPLSLVERAVGGLFKSTTPFWIE